MTKEMNEECKRLLTLLGVPVIDAPTEAEAQCSSMARVRAGCLGGEGATWDEERRRGEGG